MTVSTARELADSPQGEFTTNKENQSAKFTRKFLVESDSYSDGVITVVNAVGVPRPFQQFAFGDEDHAARVVNRSAERAGPNSLSWIVTVDYETIEKDEDEFENPLLEPADIQLTFENTQEPVYFALDSGGDPVEGIKNSAGELYNPKPVKDVARPVLKITRNEDILSPVVALASSMVNSINSGGFWGAGAGKVRCTGISVDRETKEINDEGDLFPYLKVSYEFKFHERSWNLILLDYGSYYFDGNGNKKEFKTEDGHPFLDLLNGAGRPGGPFFLPPFQVYPAADFSVLNLPTSFVS